jgi:UDP-glucose-4-epimerase GalE
MIPNILVTGGAGYIGSHTCKELARRGFNPIGFDNLSRGSPAAVKWGPLIIGDLLKKRDLWKAFADFEIHGVVHFAALAYVGESVSEPGRYFRNNVAGTLNLLDAMAEAGVPNLVFSSSCAVYGIPARVPIAEDAVTKPVNPYGESKLQTEKMLPWFGKTHGLKWAALRYFNAAGADPEGEIGENHEPETHLIPLAIQAAVGSGPALRVFGTDYPTPDGTAIRDYIHVSDLADAHVRALDYLRQDGESSAFNLGTGHGFSVREISDAVARVAKSEVPLIESPRREGDPPMLIADTSRANAVLGWNARHSDLDSIVRTALAWERTKLFALAAE